MFQTKACNGVFYTKSYANKTVTWEKLLGKRDLCPGIFSLLDEMSKITPLHRPISSTLYKVVTL